MSSDWRSDGESAGTTRDWRPHGPTTWVRRMGEPAITSRGEVHAGAGVAVKPGTRIGPMRMPASPLPLDLHRSITTAAHVPRAILPAARSPRRTLPAILFLLLLLTLGSLAACGKKGPPEPPGPPEKVTYPRIYPTR